MAFLAGCGAAKRPADASGENAVPEKGMQENWVQENQAQENAASSGTVELPDLSGINAENQACLPRIREYMELVEAHMEGTFSTMDAEETKELSSMLEDHYEMIGRTDGEKRSYYLALRRADAPVYESVKDLDAGWYFGEGAEEEVLRIGYYDESDESVPLYEVRGYSLGALPLWEETAAEKLSCFCFYREESGNEAQMEAFRMAFSESGRGLLEFMKSHPGLALREDNQSGIEFYYQDGETLPHVSEPRRFFIPLTGEEEEEMKALLSAAGTEDGPLTHAEAKKELKNKGLFTTGVYLYLPEAVYQLYGTREKAGMILKMPGGEAYPSMESPVSLLQNEGLWSRILDRVEHTVGMDYGSFDKDWFERPLTCAVLHFPETIMDGKGGYETELRTQTVEEEEKLQALRRMLSRTLQEGEIYGFSACPYSAELIVTREDGETRRMYLAVDSCDSMAWEGRIPFEYGGQEEMAEIFDEAMRDRIVQ